MEYNKKDVQLTMKKFLIVGLGNKGDEYSNTKHNIGFLFLDYLALQQSESFKSVQYGHQLSFRLKGKKILLLKPDTYMNLSGKAVDYWVKKERLNLEQLLIVTDDLNIPFGIFRLKPNGSDGGHNGLKSIEESLQTRNYPRLRFGIGNHFTKGKQVDYVLQNWNPDEKTQLDHIQIVFPKLIESFVQSGIQRTMNVFNGSHLLDTLKEE